MQTQTVQLNQRPKLSRAARLRFDAQTQSYVLLSPERGLLLNDCASQIVQRCNGQLTIAEIASEMLAACGLEAPAHTPSTGASVAQQATKDVLDLLVDLRQRQLLFFETAL
jgi:coenzyme PQQ biosynthesis protein PqqD